MKFEESLPTELVSEASVWEILLNILVVSREQGVAEHCAAALHACAEEAGAGGREQLARAVWAALPEVLAQALVDDKDTHVGEELSI